MAEKIVFDWELVDFASLGFRTASRGNDIYLYNGEVEASFRDHAHAAIFAKAYSAGFNSVMSKVTAIEKPSAFTEVSK